MSTPSAATPRSPSRATTNTRSTCPRFPVFMDPLPFLPSPPLFLDERRVDLHLFRGELGHLPLLVGADDRRRHHDDEFGLLLLVPGAAEEGAQDRDVPEERDLG